MQQAQRSAAREEALMCNYRGELSECSQSNFFMVRERRAADAAVRGRPAGGHHARVPVRGRRARSASTCVRRRSTPRTSIRADEAFITSTTRELSPVVRIDEQVIGSGTPGPITLELLARYRRYARETTRAAGGASRELFAARHAAFRLKRSHCSEAVLPSARGSSYDAASTNASIGGHAQIRLRSPYGLSIRATLGQNFASRRTAADTRPARACRDAPSRPP